MKEILFALFLFALAYWYFNIRSCRKCIVMEEKENV